MTKKSEEEIKKFLEHLETEEESDDEDNRFRIETTTPNSIIERRTYGGDGKDFVIETLWRSGYVIVVDEPYLPDNYDPEVGIDILKFDTDIDDQDFTDGSSEFIFGDGFSIEEQEEIESVYEEEDEEGLRELGYEFYVGEYWFYGKLKIEKIES